MLALWTFIKDGLTFINRSQLDCIITHFWMSALYTGLFNCCSHRFRRFLESCLLFIALGPQRNCPIRRISGRRWQRWHFREIGSIGTYVAFNGSIGIDLKGRSARRTEWPRHGFVVWCLKWKVSRKIETDDLDQGRMMEDQNIMFFGGYVSAFRCRIENLLVRQCQLVCVPAVCFVQEGWIARQTSSSASTTWTPMRHSLFLD